MIAAATAPPTTPRPASHFIALPSFDIADPFRCARAGSGVPRPSARHDSRSFGLAVVPLLIQPWVHFDGIRAIALWHLESPHLVEHLHPFTRTMDARLVGMTFLQDIYTQEEDQL